MVLQLIRSLPLLNYHVFLDNLFVSNNFCELIYDLGISIISTYRTNSGVIAELIKLKKEDKGKNKMPWGKIYKFPMPSGKVI
jgi:hypothetical protein